MRCWPIRLLLAALLLLGSACATMSDQHNALERMQYDYSAAIRWGDFEGAWNLVDPDYKKEHPMGEMEFSRYQQIQVSGYTDLGSRMASDESRAAREIRINVINKHTMAERSMRYLESWRYDAETKRWWLTSGLPDFWAGQ